MPHGTTNPLYRTYNFLDNDKIIVLTQNNLINNCIHSDSAVFIFLNIIVKES